MTNRCCRCGKCCLYHAVIDFEKKIFSPETKRCKFLEGEIGKITSCRRYNFKHRIGTVVDDHVLCGYRQPHIKIEGCTLYP